MPTSFLFVLFLLLTVGSALRYPSFERRPSSLFHPQKSLTIYPDRCRVLFLSPVLHKSGQALEPMIPSIGSSLSRIRVLLLWRVCRSRRLFYSRPGNCSAASTLSSDIPESRPTTSLIKSRSSMTGAAL